MDQATIPDESSDSPAATTPAAKSTTRRLHIENPLQAILGAGLVALLLFAFTQTNDRITRLEDRVDAGFAAQDTKIEQRFAAQDTKIEQRFAAQDTKIEQRFTQQGERLDEINLKLTALIAALNATTTVEAALDGHLLDPNSPAPLDPDER